MHVSSLPDEAHWVREVPRKSWSVQRAYHWPLQDMALVSTMVKEAGCDFQPDWANGAWLFAPVINEQYDEAGCELPPAWI